MIDGSSTHATVDTESNTESLYKGINKFNAGCITDGRPSMHLIIDVLRRL